MQEFRLHRSTTSRPHCIAKLNVDSFDLSSCALPLRLYRGNPARAPPEGPPDAGDDGPAVADAAAIAPFGGARAKAAPFQRKTRVFFDNQSADAASKDVLKREALPWLLEDADGDVNYEGRLEGGQNQNYVLFVYENDGFAVIPVDRWYKFRQRITYRTLTTEEAEEQLKSKNVNMDRWMMHRKRLEELTAAKSEADNSVTKNFRVTSSTTNGKKGAKANADEMLFNDIFEDDEEYGEAVGEDGLADSGDERETRKKGMLMDEDEEELEKDAEKEKVREQNADTKKLLRKMKLEYRDESDDDKDPYADSDGEMLSDSGSEEESDDEKPKKSEEDSRPSSPGPSDLKRKQRDSKLQESFVAKIAGTSTSRYSREGSPVSSRTFSPVADSEKRLAKKIKAKGGQPVPSRSASPSDDRITLTEAEVVSVFRQAPGQRLQTKEIVNRLGSKVKRSEANKKELINIIKRITRREGDSFVLAGK